MTLPMLFEIPRSAHCPGRLGGGHYAVTKGRLDSPYMACKWCGMRLAKLSDLHSSPWVTPFVIKEVPYG